MCFSWFFMKNPFSGGWNCIYLSQMTQIVWPLTKII
jgi:hypothetical protein